MYTSEIPMRSFFRDTPSASDSEFKRSVPSTQLCQAGSPGPSGSGIM